ncbi:Na+/H+ antiporter subunit A [Rummeliibacillus sp. JY-2-4R]
MTINLAILLPFAMAIIVPIMYKRLNKIHIGWLALMVPLVVFTMLVRLIPSIATGHTYTHTYRWIPSLDINFTTYLDGLSMIFGLLISGIGSLVILYSIFYLSTKETLHQFYCYLLLFMGAMLGVVFSDNLMVLYVFWELTSVSSFLLIAYWHHRKASRAGAQKSMLITVFGGVSMLVGFIMLHIMTGSYSVHEIIHNLNSLSNHPLFTSAMLLILLGAFTKSAQFPFHIWLPDAMEAPTPVSAYLHSATMVKAGIYLVARLSPIFGGNMLWFWLLTIVGFITLIWGSFNAVKQTDLKALLAFSTVSQLGLIISLFGMGSVAYELDYGEDTVIYTQATFAALFHLVNHSTFKGALFMMVGIIDHEVGTRDIRRLSGLMSIMPFTFSIAVIGSLSMAGMPPFNGFLSKEMFFAAALQIKDLELFSIHYVGILFPIIAWIASVFTFIYCMIIIFKAFLGKAFIQKVDRSVHEAPFSMLVAPFILCMIVVGVFFFPNLLGQYILKPAMTSIYPNLAKPEILSPEIHAWHGLNGELLMTVAVLFIGIILYRLLENWKDVYRLFPSGWSLNELYMKTLSGSEHIGYKLTTSYMTGSLRHYTIYIYSFFILSIGGFFFANDVFHFSLDHNAQVAWYELVLLVVMCAAAVSMLVVKSRITAIILNGVLGFGVTIFFVLFRAPDLALTQLVVETVTTALFLLCFYYLPEWRKEKTSKITKVSNAIISLAIGMIVVVISLTVLDYDQFERISIYFENAYELAGGANIVNTILGDFRGFDTMLEVVVLFIAGLNVYTLIKFKVKKRGTDFEG